MPARTAWIFEQIAHSPIATEKAEPRNQVGLALDNSLDSFSTQASAIADLSWFELGVKASERTFLEVSDRGKDLKSELYDKRHLLGLEMARHYTSQSGHYGRLGIEYLAFLPNWNKWLRASLCTGVLNDSGWALRLNFSRSFPLSIAREGGILELRGEASYATNTQGTVRVGGFLGWIQRSQDTALLPGATSATFEQMMFSLGPSLEWKGPWGRLRGIVNVRLYVDKELFVRNTLVETGYPSDLVPDAGLQWATTL